MLHTKFTTWSCSARWSIVRPAVPTRVSRKCLTSHQASPASYVALGPRRLVARYRNSDDDAGEASQAVQESATGDSGTLVPVVFELAKHCPFGHAFALIGDAPQLGQWDVSQALKLEWSEGDVWRGCVSLPLDTPINFKYIQVDGTSGRLQGWGQDIAGGSNLSVLVTPSDEVMSGLKLILEPSDAADPSHQPHLAARLDTSAILPESAARFKEAQEANSDQHTPQDDTAPTDTSTAASPEAYAPAAPAFAEADAVMAADEVEMQPEAEQQEEEEEEEEVVTNIGQLQLDDGQGSSQEAAPAAEAAGGPELQGRREDQGDEGSVPVVGAVVSAGEESTAESVQQQGLQVEVEVEAEGAPEGDPLAAAADADLAEQPPAAPTAGRAAGGVSAGYEDEESVGAAVSAGLMEAGDDETMAGPTGAAAFTPTSTPPATSASSGSIKSHMITSMDLEDSETDEAREGGSSSSTEDQPAVEAMAATAQESARLASTHHASTDQGTDDSRGSLEGLPTPADSNAAAVANTMLGAELVGPLEGAEACRPPNPHSKLVAATPSVSTVDADAPLLDVSKAVTELDSSSKGVQPVDSYEEAFGALVTAAAAAAVSGSHDGWTAAPQGREGAAAAEAERVMQVARADEGAGDGEGTGTWTEEEVGGDAASGETPTAAAVDEERTGTWTAEAADAAAAAAFGPDSPQPSERATESAHGEGPASLNSKDDSSSGKGGTWLQRLLGGGGHEGGRA